MALKLKITGREGVIFNGNVDFCEIPAEPGIEGILPGHENFIANVMKGKVVYKTGNSSTEIDVPADGFAEVSVDAVNIILSGKS